MFLHGKDWTDGSMGLKNNEIEVGELIDEHNYKWIHISNPVKEKNEILHLK